MKRLAFGRGFLPVLMAVCGAVAFSLPVQAMPGGSKWTPAGMPAGRGIVVDVQATGFMDPQRNCQTLRNCNFSRGGSFRGCVSSYSCRVCRFVPAKCSTGATRATCQRQVCEWG